MTLLRSPIRSTTRSPLRGPLQDGFGGGDTNPFAALFGPGDTGDVWVPVPGQSPMFTNDAETDAADTNADSVRSFQGMVNGLNLRAPTDANRPTLNTDGTSWWLAGNNSDQLMSVPYSQSSYPLLIAGVFKTGGTNGEGIVAAYGGTTNIYKALMNYISDPFFRSFDRNASLLTNNGPVGSTPPVYVRSDFTSSNFLTHVDGTDGTPTTNTNAYGTTTHICLFDLRNAVQSPSGAECYGLIVRNRLFTDAAEEALFRDTVLSLQGLA